MHSIFEIFVFFSSIILCAASYHEQYRVPQTCTDKWETYVLHDREYVVQNLPVNWEIAQIMCRGQHNGTLAILDTVEKADFMAEVLSESQLPIDEVWVGSRRSSAEDPAGYRWSNGLELRRTFLDVLDNKEQDGSRHYPVWLNRTHVPVPEGGADCVALERIHHDHPVFVDLPCSLDRAYVCERDVTTKVQVNVLKTVRCRSGLYRVYSGLLNWHQAAAHCVLNKMVLANIATMKCLKKLGMSMLKSRPSIENAWVGAKGVLGNWTWLDTGLSIFQTAAYLDVAASSWPPLRERHNIKQNGCLQLDRHETHPPVFLEARCERKMQFICYQSSSLVQSTTLPPFDDLYYYVLVKQQLFWEHAFENCKKMNGTLASLDDHDTLIQLLLVMGENRDNPVRHVWLSGRLNMTKDMSTAEVSFSWSNPLNGKRISVPKTGETLGSYVPPWLDDDFSTDSPCLNLDREDHLSALVYGMPCDTPQASICMIEKAPKPQQQQFKSLPPEVATSVQPIIPTLASLQSVTTTVYGDGF